MTQYTPASSALTLAYTWNPLLTNLLVGVFLIISIAMILLVLIQRPQGGGLSGAFGAGGGGGGGGAGGAGQTAFGTKTGDVLTGATITIFVLFLLAAIVLNFATRPQVAASNTPTITAPAPEGTGAIGDPIEQEDDQNQGQDPGTDAAQPETIDPEQAIEDTLETTPTIESDDPSSQDTPADGGSSTPPADPTQQP